MRIPILALWVLVMASAACTTYGTISTLSHKFWFVPATTTNIMAIQKTVFGFCGLVILLTETRPAMSAIRTDVTRYGTTLGPEKMYRKQTGKLLPKCPATHPYAINYGAHCSSHNYFLEDVSSPASCGNRGDSFSWGTPMECGVPQLLMACPELNGKCNDNRDTPLGLCVPAMVVTFSDEDYSISFPLESAFTDTGCEGYEAGTEIFNYFLAQSYATDHMFKLDFGCILSFVKVRMINVNDRGFNSRGTEKFSISGSLDGVTWTFMIEEDQLTDVSFMDCDAPTEEFDLGPSVARYVTVTLKTYYGYGAGLRFIEFEY